MEANQSLNYQAYLVRFWRQDEFNPWRVTIEHVGTQVKHHFSDLEQAMIFWQTQLTGQPSLNGANDEEND